MSNWKQIQARIRRAKAGADPAAQLEKLFERTRDAMVAFELGKILEGTGRPGDAARWYEAAAQRFRRADWKKRAEEAALRLSGAGPAPESSPRLVDEPEFRPEQHPVEEAPVEEMQSFQAVPQEQPAAAAAAESAVPTRAEQVGRKRRRRGRRGGRNRRQGRQESATPTSPSEQLEHMERVGPRSTPTDTVPVRPLGAAERVSPETTEATGPGLRGRSGDPGLASRLALLEMQMRRLLVCPPVKLANAEHAPAGPGVFLVTESDLVTHYYVEACRTLRVGISALLRGGNLKGEESLKARFAEHLGIPETRVAKYVGDHCVVRWLQLDEGAPGFAHFAIAVLKPVLND